MKRKFIDEKGRFFGVASIIDIVVVAVVIVLAAAVYMRFFANEESVTEAAGSTFTYEIKARAVRQEVADMIKVGDQLYDEENRYYIGDVVNVSVEPAVQQMVLSDGTYVNAPVENRYDVYIEVETQGLISNGRYYAERSYEVSVNEGIQFLSKYVSTSGVIWSIEGLG